MSVSILMNVTNSNLLFRVQKFVPDFSILPLWRNWI